MLLGFKHPVKCQTVIKTRRLEAFTRCRMVWSLQALTLNAYPHSQFPLRGKFVVWKPSRVLKSKMTSVRGMALVPFRVLNWKLFLSHLWLPLRSKTLYGPWPQNRILVLFLGGGGGGYF